jgi:hypothetical protein
VPSVRGDSVATLSSLVSVFVSLFALSKKKKKNMGFVVVATLVSSP